MDVWQTCGHLLAAQPTSRIYVSLAGFVIMAVPAPARPSHEAKMLGLGVVQLSEFGKNHKQLDFAARLLDGYFNRDARYPDLDQLVVSRTSEFYAAQDLVTASGYKPFKIGTTAFPEDLHKRINAKDSSPCKMGLLPRIERVWIAQGASLYLWQYTRNSQIQSFEEMKDEIMDVQIATPRPNVFVNTVKALLVITTSSTMYMYAISHGSDISDISVYDTGIKIPVHDMGPLRICSMSSTGRIFFTGKNRGIDIWEAVCSNQESWFKPKCRKVRHTGGNSLSHFFQSATSTPQPEYVIDSAIDESRSLLYTLSNKSTIRVYTIGANDGSVVLQCTYPMSKTQQHLGFAMAGSDILPMTRNCEFISISPVENFQSEYVRLVAVSSSGLRIYFRCDNLAGNPTYTFQALYARQPPLDGKLGTTLRLSYVLDSDMFVAVVEGAESEDGKLESSASAEKKVSNSKPENTKSEKDLATRNTERNLRLFMSVFDSTRVLHQLDVGTQPSFAELSGWLSIRGSVQSIKLIRGGPQVQRGRGNHTAQGYANGERQFCVLTNYALYSVQTRLFSERLEIGTDPVSQLTSIYGNMEICCAALSVATRPSASISRSQRNQAVSTYFRYGGLPVFKKDMELTRNIIIDDPKTAIGSSAKAAETPVLIRLSALFDGLAAYLSRLLQELWMKNIVTYKRQRDGKVFNVRFSISRELLERIYEHLSGLWECLSENRSFSEGMGSRPQYSPHVYVGDVSVLNQTEHRSLAALEALVKSCRQGIAFLLLIQAETSTNPNGVESLLTYFSQENYEKFLTMSYRDFFSEAKESQVARELVTCLVNYVINRGDIVDSVAHMLQKRCDSYFSGGDVLVYKALEYLHAAEAAASPNEGDIRLQNLYQSVRLLKKAAGIIQLDTLRDIVNEYIHFEFYPGIAEVVLAVAGEIDPANTALGYLRENKPVNDLREPTYRAKLECFELLFKVLKNIDADSPAGKETYRIMIDNNDELFHFCLYDWLLNNDRADVVAQLSTSFLLPYLQLNAKQNVQVAELLWKYYHKRGDTLAAADVLLALARGSVPVKMDQRLEFLGRAMGFCNLVYPQNARQLVVRMTTMVQAYLRIATIQSDICREVEQDTKLDDSNREEALKMLNSRLLTATELYNFFAEPLGYYSICLSIFELSDYRELGDICSCWQKLFEGTRSKAAADQTRHYAQISQLIQTLGRKFLNCEFIFPVTRIVPLAEKYSFEHCAGAPAGWVAEAFLKAGVPHKVLYDILMGLLRQHIHPFDSFDAQQAIANDVCAVVSNWSQFDRWAPKESVTTDDQSLLSQHTEVNVMSLLTYSS